MVKICVTSSYTTDFSFFANFKLLCKIYVSPLMLWLPAFWLNKARLLSNPIRKQNPATPFSCESFHKGNLIRSYHYISLLCCFVPRSLLRSFISNSSPMISFSFRPVDFPQLTTTIFIYACHSENSSFVDRYHRVS